MTIQQPERLTMQRELPPGWRIVRFEQMAENITQRVDNPAEAGVSRYVGLEHLDPEALRIRRWGLPTDVEATKLRFQPGDIIFGRRRAYQRKLAVADFEGICSAHALVLRAREETVLKEFLPFFMQSDTFFGRAMAISVGSLSPTINWKSLAQQEFALPPKDEQRRIAEILWAADEEVEQLKECLAQSEKLRRLLLDTVVLKGVRPSELKDTEIGAIPAHWAVETVGRAGNVQLGRQRAPQYQTGKNSRPYLRVANVFDGYLELDDVLEMDFDESEFARYVLRPGDILLNEGQSRELVGRSCIYQGEIEGCCFQNTLVRFRPYDNLLPDYAHAYFQRSYYKGIFAQIARQTTSIAHLGADRFAKLKMPVPPIPEQAKICQHISTAKHVTDDLQRKRDATASLKKSLLAHFFSAEIHKS